jgi:hypothetical protein
MDKETMQLVKEIEELEILLLSSRRNLLQKCVELDDKFRGQKYQHRKTGIIREVDCVDTGGPIYIFWKGGICSTPNGNWLESTTSLKNLNKSYKKV